MNDANEATLQAANWLANLDRALTETDIAGAVALFADECY
jgi:hypothetical protein